MPRRASPCGCKSGGGNEKALLASSGETEDVSPVLEASCAAVSSVGKGLPTVVVMPDWPGKLSIVPTLPALTGLVCVWLSPDTSCCPVTGCRLAITSVMGALMVVAGLGDCALLTLAGDCAINELRTCACGLGLVSVTGDEAFWRISACAMAAVIVGGSSRRFLLGRESSAAGWSPDSDRNAFCAALLDGGWLTLTPPSTGFEGGTVSAINFSESDRTGCDLWQNTLVKVPSAMQCPTAVFDAPATIRKRAKIVESFHECEAGIHTFMCGAEATVGKRERRLLLLLYMGRGSFKRHSDVAMIVKPRWAILCLV
jgi:hypothetical protein